MADDKKKTTTDTAPAEKKPEKKVKPKKPAPKPTAAGPRIAQPTPETKRRDWLKGRKRKERKAPVQALAAGTNTTPTVLAALKAAYGWTDRTKLTRGEFLDKRDRWLNKPANEV